MSKLFTCIDDFIQSRQKCFFCEANLKCRLSNFIGVRETGVPLLNSPLKDGKFIFNICHTAPSYTLNATGMLNTSSNVMTFSLDPQQKTTQLDEKVMEEAFIDLRPYIQQYCPKRNCAQKYNISSSTLLISAVKGAWLIHPLATYYEIFTTGKLVVMNDYFYSNTKIHSLNNENADPLIVPLLDFHALGKNKLLIRAQTLATFS